MSDTPATNTGGAGAGGESRRDFLLISTTVLGAAGAAAAVWPFIHSINPAADVRALSSTEADLSKVEEGQAITVMWRGKPVFIRHRSADDIANAVKGDGDDMRDPSTDADRIQKPEWLILIGICTHLGCIPSGQKAGDLRGEFGGWYCPCHGSHYDTSGRIRKGPAPKNLAVPPYVFLDDASIKIG